MVDKRNWMACEVELAVLEWLLGCGCESVITHFYPQWWHECDVYGITRFDYGIEIEVKTSVADFKADFKKRQKHKALAAAVTERKSPDFSLGYNPGVTTGVPRRYYFAVPEGMIGIQDVPDYAGLLYAKRYKATQWRVEGVKVTVVKRAPNLQAAKKLTENQMQKLSAAYRFHYYTVFRQFVKAACEKR